MGIFVRQLDGSPFAGENCGPASVASALRWSTEHTVAPTPSLVRARLGDTDGGTKPSELPTAWESFREPAKRRGYELAEIRYRESVDFAKLPELLWRGDAAMVAVDYSKVPRELRGDPDFLGYHAVFAAAISQKAGTTKIKIYDPLCDGRRATIPGPGPVWWTLSILREASGGYAGRARATYNAVSRSKRTGEPDAHTCSDIAEELAIAEKELGEAQEVLGTVQATLRLVLSESEAIASASREALALIEDVLPKVDPTARSGTGLAKP